MPDNICIFLIKPDAIEQGLASTIIDKIIATGLKIRLRKTVQLTEAMVRQYQPVLNMPSEHADGWQKKVIDFMTSRPVEVIVAEGTNALAESQRIKRMVRDSYLISNNHLDTIIRNLLHTADSVQDLELDLKVLCPEHLRKIE